MKDISIIVPSNRPDLAVQAKKCLSGNFEVIIHDGANYPSFSKLINDCIVEAKHEIVIIVNHKIRAHVNHILKMIDLLNTGYGLVCLQNFHFFGFKKDLIRKIGFFDERFLGGGYEDADFVRRLIENNIGFYDSTETMVLEMRSSWDKSRAESWFYQKWKDGKLERLVSDETYDYDIGSSRGSTFLDLSHTVLSKTNADYFNSIYFNFKK